MEESCYHIIDIVHEHSTQSQRNLAIFPWLKQHEKSFDLYDKCWLIKRFREHGLVPHENFHPIMDIIDTWIDAWIELHTNEEWCFNYYYGNNQNVIDTLKIVS